MQNDTRISLANFKGYCLKYIFTNLDLIGGGTGFFIGLNLLIFGSSHNSKSLSEIGYVISIVSFFYLIFNKKENSITNKSLYVYNKNYFYFSNIIFFLCSTISFIIAHNSIHRPNIYFILVSISIAMLSIEILYSLNKNYGIFTILKIIFLSYNLNSNFFSDFAGYYGVDPWYHVSLVTTWSKTGHIIHNEVYSNFPIFHLEVSILKELTNLDLKNSLFYSIGLIYIISILFVFLVGRAQLNYKGGLLAALLLCTSEFFIMWGSWIIPTSLGVFLISIFLYFIFCTNKNYKNSLLMIILSFTLIFMHSLSAYVFLIMIIILRFSDKLLSIINEDGSEDVNLCSSFALLFFISLIYYWISINYQGAEDYSFFQKIISMFTNTLASDTRFTGSFFKPSDFPLNRVGILIYIALIGFGSLYWLNFRRTSKKRYMLLFLVIILSIITLSSQQFNIDAIIPDRWFIYIILVAIPIAAQSLLLLSRLINPRYLVPLIFLGSFFSINTFTVNPYTPFYGELSSDPTRLFVTQSELDACRSILQSYEGYSGNITSDLFYSNDVFPFEEKIYNSNLSIKQYNSSSRSNDVIILRDYIINHSHMVQTGKIEKIDYNNYYLIYNDKEVRVYERNKQQKEIGY